MSGCPMGASVDAQQKDIWASCRYLKVSGCPMDTYQKGLLGILWMLMIRASGNPL